MFAKQSTLKSSPATTLTGDWGTWPKPLFTSEHVKKHVHCRLTYSQNLKHSWTWAAQWKPEQDRRINYNKLITPVAAPYRLNVNLSEGYMLKELNRTTEVTLTSNDKPDEMRNTADAVSCGTSVEARLLGINWQPADWRLGNVTTL